MTTAPALVPLVARTVAIADPGPLLTLLPPGPGLAWVRHGEGLVGWGEAMRVTGTGESRFDTATRTWSDLMKRAVIRDEVRLPGTGPVAFGSFAFSPSSSAGGVLVVPEVVVGHRGGTWWLTTITADGALPAPVGLERHERDLEPPAGTEFVPGARGPEDWKATVGEAISRIEAGEVEKVVLARDVLARTAEDVDPRDVLARLAGGYPNCWTFSVDGLLGATPEMLVKLERGLVTSRVLAGTIRRAGTEEEDLALAASLARSSKDLEEHEYAVRSVADALAPHCTTTNVPDSPFVLHLPNVMHLATDVTGVLADGATSLDLAAALHPSAAVCGTPTPAAAKLIEAVEGMDRGRYAGPVGWVDSTGDGEWGIALRSTQVDPEDPRRFRLFAGGGIVAGSDPVAELAETEAKLLPVKGALSR